MSLIITIRSDKKYESSGTGVFVKDSSGIRELQTLDEVRAYYPDFDIFDITPEYYSSCDIWSSEITHNSAYLASHVEIKNSNLYYYLWRPAEIGYDYLSTEYIEGIKDALDKLSNSNEILLKFGSEEEINELAKFLDSFYNCLKELKINYSDEFQLIVQR